ncbi:helix-turn-helix domain-containing protein [Pseudomonas sp. TWP3-2]|uniref:helix-turn-helix domain-containing protein n=1 Tax=Pseudomonas sp. TWP3-2 TaxID=2804574 RepID=UPI003CF7678E
MAKPKLIAPDASLHNTDAAYVAQVIKRTGMSQRACAARVGVSHATLKNWIAGTHEWSYPAQYALECLAAFADVE